MKHLSILIGPSLFIFAACSTNVVSDSETGKHSITCHDAMSACYSKATEICPDGYLVTNRVRPRETDDGIQYTYNIKCRNARLP